MIELEFNRPDNNGKDPHPDAAGPNYIIVGHSDGSITAYYHLKQNSIKVSLNQTVKAGDLIAEVGNSAANPPHLHLGYSGTNGFGEFTLRPMRFEGLYMAEEDTAVTENPGTDFYRSFPKGI